MSKIGIYGLQGKTLVPENSREIKTQSILVFKYLESVCILV